VRFRRNLGVDTKKYEFKAMANRVAFDKNDKAGGNDNDEKILNKMRIDVKTEKETPQELSPEEKETYMRSKSHFKTVKYRTKSLNLKNQGNYLIILILIIL